MSVRRLFRDTCGGVLRIRTDSAAPVVSAFTAAFHRAGTGRIPARRPMLAQSALGGFWALSVRGMLRGACGVVVRARLDFAAPIASAFTAGSRLAGIGRIPVRRTALAQCALEGFRALCVRRLLRDSRCGVLPIRTDAAAPNVSAFTAAFHLAFFCRIPAGGTMLA